ncbi:glycosyltransferase, partial [Escherichia coli]
MKVSIITVTYNSEKTIKDTLDSVAVQTYNNIEYIIVDGASSDATLHIINNSSASVAK